MRTLRLALMILAFAMAVPLLSGQEEGGRAPHSGAETKRPTGVRARSPRYDYSGLPDISTFLRAPSDRFLADIDHITGGCPFKGVNSSRPHGGAHIYFDNSANTWPKAGTNPENCPPIYAVADAIITRIDYSFRLRTGADRYGLDLCFASDKGGSGYRLCHSIEPFVPEPSESFYRRFILVSLGQRVKKGDIIAYMYMPPGMPNVHIHFHVMRMGRSGFMAPAIFTPDLVKQFHAKWDSFRRLDDGKPMPPCMGYRIGAEENPFGTGAKDTL